MLFLVWLQTRYDRIGAERLKLHAEGEGTGTHNY